MSLSQPLGLGDKLRQALQEAQSLLASTPLQAKLDVGIDPARSAGAEASLDRTAKDAKEAIENSNPKGGEIGPGDSKLTDAIDKLTRALEGAGGAVGGGSGRRRRSAAGDIPEPPGGEGEAGPGYVNPYLLQGLIQNPVGTTHSSLMSMLMGGAGAGLKAPGWLMNAMAGSGGTFAPGTALASETGLLSSGASGGYASGTLIGAAKVAVPIAAFGGTMALQNSKAKDRLQDAKDWGDDARFGRGAGFDWRGGAWASWGFSRDDLFQDDVKRSIQGMGVGLAPLRSARGGDRALVDHLAPMGDVAWNLGLDPGQLGSVIGASVRSGTTNLASSDPTSNVTGILTSINAWVRRGAEVGLASAESISRLGEVMQLGAQGTVRVTRDNQLGLMSLDARIRTNLGSVSPDLVRSAPGVVNTLSASGANDVQTVLMMNQFLGSDGSLNSAGESYARGILGAEEVESIKRNYGQMAGTMIAHQLTKTRGGAAAGRTLATRSMRARGASGAQIGFTLFGGDVLSNSLAMDMTRDGSLLDDVRAFRDTGAGLSREGDVDSQGEQALIRKGQVVNRESGLTAEGAEAIIGFTNSVKDATLSLTQWADQLRMQPSGLLYPFVDPWRPTSIGDPRPH